MYCYCYLYVTENVSHTCTLHRRAHFIVSRRELTFFDDEEGHDECHGVAGVDVVAAVDVLLVDGQARAREQLEHPLQDHQNLERGKEMVKIGITYEL